MMVYQIAYNPYKVDLTISTKDGDSWIPISQNSTLVRFSRIRLQRSIRDQSKNAFFYELFNSSGEDDIEISFLGTDEDYYDFQEAVTNFNRINIGYHIELRKDCTSSLNSTKRKKDILSSLMINAKNSKYRNLLPDKIWKGIDDALASPSNEAVLIPLGKWSDYRKEIFSDDSWRLFCFVFCFSELKSKTVRDAFRGLSKEFENLSDRPFEKERFVFVCTYNDCCEVQNNTLRKVLMEYGVQDIAYSLISDTDYLNIDDPEFAMASDALQELQQHIITFRNRYASQYKLRKSIDSIQKEIQKEELTPGSKLKRKVDTILKDRKTGDSLFSDKEVEEAYKWLVNTLNSISQVIELES